jgi:hypothetical protein
MGCNLFCPCKGEINPMGGGMERITARGGGTIEEQLFSSSDNEIPNPTRITGQSAGTGEQGQCQEFIC